MHTVLASRLIVLSAGAMGSPLVLERSGIGAASVLEKAGIKQFVDLPGVGKEYDGESVFYLRRLRFLNIKYQITLSSSLRILWTLTLQLMTGFSEGTQRRGAVSLAYHPSFQQLSFLVRKHGPMGRGWFWITGSKVYFPSYVLVSHC